MKCALDQCNRKCINIDNLQFNVKGQCIVYDNVNKDPSMCLSNCSKDSDCPQNREPLKCVNF